MLRKIAGFGLMFLLVGCAAMLQSREQVVRFSSEPPGATVLLNGDAAPQPTPMTMVLNPREGYRVQMTKDGRQSCEEPLPQVETMEMSGSLMYPVRKFPSTIHRILRQDSCP